MMNKRQDIELLRIVSALGIIWYHSRAKGHEISLASLIVFLILSMYLVGSTTIGLAAKITKRSKRLLVPWIVWCIFYAVVNILDGRRIFPVGNNIVSQVLIGPAVHLWYLPFIFVSTVLADIAGSKFSKKYIGLFSGVGAIAVLGSTPFWRQASLQYGFPVSLWAHAAAGVFLGTFMSCAQDVGKTTTISVISASMLISVIMIRYVDVGIPYAIGIAVALLILGGALERFIKVDLTYLSSLTLGVYLVHMFFLDHLRLVFGLAGYSLPLAAIVLSATSAALLRRYLPGLS